MRARVLLLIQSKLFFVPKVSLAEKVFAVVLMNQTATDGGLFFKKLFLTV